MNIKFSPPDISEKEIKEVAEALSSGWITTGPRVKKLEKKIAEYVGTPKCVCLNSQTACAEMALRVLGIGEGDEVITSAYTYTASASVVCHVGAKLILVDTQKTVLNRIIRHWKTRLPIVQKPLFLLIWVECLATTTRYSRL